METATLRRAPPIPAAVQVGLVAFLLALAGTAWAVTGDRMDGMDAGPGTELGSLGRFVGLWVTMMAAMMLPSLQPVVLTHARLRTGSLRPIAATAAFVAGFLGSWAGAGLLGYALFDAARSLEVGFLAWDDAGRYVAGGVLFGAALWELTAPKDACLRHCRSPGLLLEDWRSGRLGAVRMGIEHGGVCIGCCWALMAALFALGVMSIGWMALVAVLIAAEKLLPWKRVAVRGVAIVLAALALAVVIAPEDVPGLTIPGSPEAMDAMGMEPESGAIGGKSEGGAIGVEPEGGGMGGEPGAMVGYAMGR
jgi:predicted metal-binding membrane protein